MPRKTRRGTIVVYGRNIGLRTPFSREKLRRTIIKQLSAILVVVALATTSPAAAEVIDDWDTDGDGVLSRDEWNIRLTEAGLFSDWDANDDGTLTSDEFAGGLFERFDDDDDGSLTVREWDEGIDSFYGEAAVDASFESWNSDGDQVLSEEEFTAGYNEVGLFEDFASAGGIDDAEDGVGEDEFLGGLFDWFDDDDDSGIVTDEAGWFG